MLGTPRRSSSVTIGRRAEERTRGKTRKVDVILPEAAEIVAKEIELGSVAEEEAEAEQDPAPDQPQ